MSVLYWRDSGELQSDYNISLYRNEAVTCLKVLFLKYCCPLNLDFTTSKKH